MGNRPGSFIDKLKNRIYRKHSISKSSQSNITTENTSLETFLLVWLDPNIDTSKENIRTQKRLRKILTCLLTFNKVDECRRWLEKCYNEEKIILIVSGAYGQEIVPKIHDLSCIVSIYVYCLDVERNKIWSKDFRKIRGVESSTNVLLEELENHQNHLENIEDSRALRICQQNEPAHSIENRTASLVWYRLLLEILIQPNYLPTKGTYHEFIHILRQYSSNDEDGSNLIDEFEQTYEPTRAVSWLTRDTPLIRFVNKALREQDINILFPLRFLLVDIYTQLTKNQAPSLNVFRLQLMPKTQIEDLRSNPGRLIIVNGFLFATTNKSQLLSTIQNNEQFETVLFDIQADFRSGTVPFAYLQQFDSYNEQQIEREILFMCGSIFEVGSLRYENSIWRLQLRLTSENDVPVLSQMKQNLRETKNLNIISDLLKKINQEDKARIFAERIANEQLTTAVTSNSQQIKSIQIQSNFNELLTNENILFVLINLSTYFNESTSAVLKILCSIEPRIISIVDNETTTIDLSQCMRRELTIFTTVQFANTIKKYSEDFQFFILDTDNQNNQKYRYSTIDDLINRLVDCIIEKYRFEISKALKTQNQTKVKDYNQQINRIYRQLKQIHFNHDSFLSNTHQTTLIWLRSADKNDNLDIEPVNQSFRDYFPMNLHFFQESELREYLAADNHQTDLFLIISSDYQMDTLVDLRQYSNIKYTYYYGEMKDKNSEYKILSTRDDLCYQLTYDLLEYYGNLGEQYRINNQAKQARQMFSKAQRLCQILSENYFSSK